MIEVRLSQNEEIKNLVSMRKLYLWMKKIFSQEMRKIKTYLRLLNLEKARFY